MRSQDVLSTMIEITDQPIDTSRVLANVEDNNAGAVVLFLGTTREVTGDQVTRWLDYEAYQPMAEKKMAELEAEARQRWPILHCTLVHRVGRVEIREASVAVAVSSPHRDAAFEASRWLIDTLKENVPIWKCEHWADGSSQWVHPGVDAPTTAPEEAKP
ncbi:MAG: molybdenum cofactor biosynthesis protein MoaE [Pirellulales bacterium]|nr:molybdenum cofactor biosynthesis protein MoaE [Pirellulales bacterium]